MNCPICNSSELSQGATNCSVCQSDLKIFSYLEDARKRHLFQKRSIASLAVLLAIVAVGWGATRYFWNNESSRNPYRSESEQGSATTTAADSNAIAALKTENGILTVKLVNMNAENGSLKAEIKALQEKNGHIESSTASQQAITHVVKEGESLWKIAENYYKDGFQYKKIAEDNGLTDPQSIRTGTELKIRK